MKVLAIIPARGGSKGIQHKNLRDLAGKPLIAWTIEAALTCPKLDRVIVSTDNEDIAATARQCGAETPFIRPPELAQDLTPTIPAIVHAVEWIEQNEGYQADYVMCLQPTSPLCTAEDLEKTVRLANEKKADAVVSVVEVEAHPYWMKHLDDEGRMTDFTSSPFPVFRRQDLPTLYALNGAIYLARRDVLIGLGTWYTTQTYAYIMPPERSLDINTPWDLYLANLVLRDRAVKQTEAKVFQIASVGS